MTQEEMEKAIKALVDRSEKQKKKIKELEDKINNLSGIDQSLINIGESVKKIADKLDNNSNPIVVKVIKT